MKHKHATNMTILVFLALMLSTGRAAAQQERIFSPDFGSGGRYDGVTGKWHEFPFHRAEVTTDKKYSNQPVLWCRKGGGQLGKENYGYSKHDCGSPQSIIPCPEPGTRYTFKARARIAELTFRARSSVPEAASRDESPRRIFVEFSDKDGKRTIPVEFHVTEKTYQDFAKTFTVPKDAVWCRVWILCAAHRPNLYVTSVSLKSAEPDDTPKVPTGLRVVETGSTMVRLQWDAVPGASGYLIERKASRGQASGFNAVAVTLEGGRQTSFLDTLDINTKLGILRQGTSWDYRVCALADYGNSAFSEPVSAALPDRKDSPGNTSYYISASTGNDANSGTTAKTPWKSFVPLDKINLAPGDRVILKQGDVWYEPLHLHGSGAAGKEIIVGPDGSSKKSTIIRVGARANAAISMPDVSHCKVQNLEISNWHPFYRQRYGCALQAGTWLTPEVNNITLDHLFVNKVCASYGRGGSAQGLSSSGGMGIRVAGTIRRYIKGKSSESVKEGMGWVRGLRITNCILDDVDSMGINLSRVEDFVVSHNRTDKIGCIALLSSNLRNGTISHNRFQRAGWYFLAGDNAHIGCYGGKNVVFEHNIIDRTYNTASGQSLNLDSTDSYVIQYNYLKDSEAGSFVLNHGAPDNIIRYNICEGLTREGLIREWLRDLGGVRTQVYNNTVYLKNGQRPILADNRVTVNKSATPVRGLLFCNNVFYNADGLSRDEEGFQLHRATKGAEDILITHNLYYKASDDDFRGLKDAAPVFADPLFQGPVGEGKPEAYKLKPGSPCIGAGKVVKGNGGKDFFGNPVPDNAPPTIGAFQEETSR